MALAQVKYRYQQDVAMVFRQITDPEFTRRKCQAMGDHDIQVSKTENTVTSIRVVEVAVPSFAKRFVQPTNKVIDIKVWNPVSKSGQLFVEVEGMPIKITGDIQLTTVGAECDYSVNFEVSCKIPIIGGQLEKFIAQTTQEGMKKEYLWNLQNLES